MFQHRQAGTILDVLAELGQDLVVDLIAQAGLTDALNGPGEHKIDFYERKI